MYLDAGIDFFDTMGGEMGYRPGLGCWMGYILMLHICV